MLKLVGRLANNAVPINASLRHMHVTTHFDPLHILTHFTFAQCFSILFNVNQSKKPLRGAQGTWFHPKEAQYA